MTPSPPPREFGAGAQVVAYGLVALVACYAAIFAYAIQNTTYDTWGALWLGPVLVTISIPFLLRYARGEPDARIGRILVAALVFKLLATAPRHYMVTEIYGTGDSLRYAHTGTNLRDAFLQGDFSLAALGTDRVLGTQFIEIVTGVAYTLIGPSFVGGFVFFSWLSFWGLFFFYRAFRVGIPDGDTIRYALLLFFLPSMLFWPSSIGKEAWMTFALGLTTYGCALLITRSRGSSIFLLLGLAGVLMVRPHLALIVVAGIAIGYVLRGSAAPRVISMGRTRAVLGLGVIGVGTLLVMQRVAQYFGLSEISFDAAAETLEFAETQTSQGGSEFVGSRPTLPNLPRNIVTVLFRPFIFEVGDLNTLLTALEGTALMTLFVLSLPRLLTIPRRIRKQPFIAYCVTYAISFCFMFSVFQNFGLLARQRVLVFPLVLVLLALPLVRQTGRGAAKRSFNEQEDAAGELGSPSSAWTDDPPRTRLEPEQRA